MTSKKGSFQVYKRSLIVLMLTVFILISINSGISVLKAEVLPELDPKPEINENLIQATVDFSVPTIENVVIQGKVYDRIIIKGLMNAGNPGEPVLPLRTLNLLIPLDKEITSTEVLVDGGVILDGRYLIEPGQLHTPLSNTYGDLEALRPDQGIYGSCNVFPEEPYEFVTMQRLSGYKIAVYNLYPISYIPEEGRIAHYTRFTLSVYLKPVLNESTATRLRTKCKQVNHHTIDRIKGLVDNPSIVSALRSYTVPRLLAKGLPSSMAVSDSYEYIIITDQMFEEAFQPLIEEKMAKGLSARIITTEWIYENFDGSRPDGGVDRQTKIRNFIRYAYETWNTQYVLLGGDADSEAMGNESESPIVPCRILYDTIYGTYYPDEAYIASDLYYACLDGTFDFNKNGIYGEIDDGEDGWEVDLLAEVYVGRAPVDSIEEVHNFVSKTLAHENANPAVWKNKMVGEDLYPFKGISRYADSYLEEVRLGTSSHGYSTTGIESSLIQNHLLYESSDYTWDSTTLIHAMNGSGTHYYNHMGHSYVDYNMKLTIDDVDGLTNPQPFFIYSQGCYAASFDNRDGSIRFSHDSIAEHFVTGEHGAFAYIGNTRYGWAMNHSTNGASQRFHRCFWDAILDSGIRELGRANQQSKEVNIGYVATFSPVRWCYFEITLLGDPQLSIGDFPLTSAKPAVPTHVVASEEEYNNEVMLTWLNNPDVLGYIILRSESYDSESATSIATVVSSVDDYWAFFIDNTAEPGMKHFYWVKSYNSYYESGISEPSAVYTHQPPVADAGEDCTIWVGSKDDTVEVSLDGSGSYDPLGEDLQYEWIMDGNTVAEVPKPSITLKAGAKNIILKVSTTRKWNSDALTVTVKVKKPPMQNNHVWWPWGAFNGTFANWRAPVNGWLNSSFIGFMNGFHNGYFGGFTGNSWGGYFSNPVVPSYSGLPNGPFYQWSNVYNERPLMLDQPPNYWPLIMQSFL